MIDMKIKQLSIFLQNRMGSLSKPLEVLTIADVNIRAMCMADTSEFGILRLVVDDPIKGKEALEENNFLVKITDIIGVEMNDAPGGLTTVLRIIKDNLIDLEYLYAFSHDKEGKAILLLHADKLDELISVLNENKIPLVSAEEVYNL
ncbi:MAG: acetolactate synthase [Methanobrevibacter sp.]|uniref:acetolactate synthase n=1 Tax=Methanobrevibacter sp. TaxID=66852 RepID=UPI0025D8C326|nr:acetolactate synthase [Methanobrevibacter sp.]MBR3112422.1 acetolactate synthase [Methanobrevibacter sp.]MBR6992960.1 acetolactate synthase [Methanobrevibacter sp.]